MDELIIIGTIHENITPLHELYELLNTYDPDTLLVEITQEDLVSETIETYPPEMQGAYHWAKKHAVCVRGFDVDITIEKSKINRNQQQKDLEKIKQQLTDIGWKEANKRQYRNISKEFFATYCDQERFRNRQEKMAEHIKKFMKSKTVVVTGAAHLEFFSQQFPNATFPLR
jgi:hypothetical protein